MNKFKGETLKELVDFYIKNCLQGHPGSTTQQRDFKKLLNYAKIMRWFDQEEKDRHQWRLSWEDTICPFADKLEASSPELEGKHTFKEVFESIFEIGKAIPGIGPLTIYDTALRLCLPRGMEPEKVYLHAGAWEGAKHLKNKEFENGGEYLVVRFPQPLHVLKPWELENFLCVCKCKLCELNSPCPPPCE